jgi:hypothetical protein
MAYFSYEAFENLSFGPEGFRHWVREDVFIDNFSVGNLRLRMCNFNKIKISVQLFYGSGISSTQ